MPKGIINEGTVTYDGNLRCKNIIRLKKSIRQAFPDLYDLDAQINYRMEFYTTYVALLKRTFQIIEHKELKPVLLFISKNKNSK